MEERCPILTRWTAAFKHAALAVSRHVVGEKVADLLDLPDQREGVILSSRESCRLLKSRTPADGKFEVHEAAPSSLLLLLVTIL